MRGNAVFVWIFLGLATVVLVLITLYVDSWRRVPRRGGLTDQDDA
jgi:hypothetical protein